MKIRNIIVFDLICDQTYIYLFVQFMYIKNLNDKKIDATLIYLRFHRLLNHKKEHIHNYYFDLVVDLTLA